MGNDDEGLDLLADVIKGKPVKHDLKAEIVTEVSGVVWSSDNTAEAAYWRSRDEAMYHATRLGSDFGRPICTGIGVAEDDTSWFIRVDFHSMTGGDTFLIVRNRHDMGNVGAEVQRIRELNKAAILAELEQMQAKALEEQQEQQESAGSDDSTPNGD